ncbi:MAG: glycerophosphodiester phosphodiesterase family protein [Paracoccaceae bacterium]
MRNVFENYRHALHLLAPFLTTHVFFRLAMTALILPVMGLLLALTLRLSDQTALTDQDILYFILTPAGAIGALVLASLLIAAAILDVAVMSATLRSQSTRPFTALREGIGFAIASMPPLVRVTAGLLVRVIGIALPFLAIGGTLYFTRLSEFDINYYLTYQPPEFLSTVVMIGIVVVALLAVVVERLTGWALVLPLVLFARRPARAAFRESRSIMQGHRLRFLMKLAVWLAIRLGIGAILSGITALGLLFVPDLYSGSLARAALVVMSVFGLSLSATTILNAVSNGALADLINELFDHLSHADLTEAAQAARTVTPFRAGLTAAISGALVLSAAGAAIGGAMTMVERAVADREVDVIGHRGAAALRPENTMASILKAIEDGADWVEIDVQENADGQVIVAHDSDFMKAAGDPVKVWDVTDAHLAEIDIGSWFDPAYAGERVPTLRDVLLAAKDKSKVIIELKYYGHDIELEKRVVEIVEDTGMAEQISTMSLKYPAVQKMRALRPEWRTGVLAATAIGDLTGLEGDFIAVNLGQVSPRLIQRSEAAGKDVYAWTVNDPLTMSRMISMGVNGLITDDPALARQVIAERNALPTVARLALWLGNSVQVTLDDPELEP